MDASPTQLETLLATQDTPCPSCNYNLRGLKGDVCPECSQSLVLRVGLAEPRIGGLIAAASGLLAGAGAGLVCLALVVLFSLRHGLPNRRDIVPVFLIPTLCILIQGGLAILLLRVNGRRWFREQGETARTGAVACGWVLTAAAVLWFFLSIR